MAKERDKTTFKEYPSLILKGFLMGAADVVPGVSGGTMALILGIYNRLLLAIKSVDTSALKSLFSFKIVSFFQVFHWKFLIGLLIGIGSAIVFFTRIVPLPEIMYSHPEPIYGLYFGLILGSIFLLIKSLKQLELSSLFFIGLGTLIGWWIVNLVPTQTPETNIFVFFSGALAICAMILPGISGSFILLILGKYQFILSQVSLIGSDETPAAITILFFFGAGMIVGIALFSRFLSWLLARFHKPTLCVLIGFLIGSLSVIWPYQSRSYEETVRTSVVPFLDEKVQEILNNPVSDLEKPEFYRIQKIVSEDLPADERQVVLEKVKMKLIHSEPFLPSLKNADSDLRLKDGTKSLIWGFVSMLIGLVLVVGIEKLADREE